MRQWISREEASRLYPPPSHRGQTMDEIILYGRKEPYWGPDLFDVAPPGVHALLAFRNVHRFTGVLDGTSLAVQT